MTTTTHAYGPRDGQRLTVAPGTTGTLTLNSDYQGPFALAIENQSTVGAAAVATVAFIDGGIAVPLGINETGAVEAGGVHVVAFPSAVRSITVVRAADSDAACLVEVLQ